MISLVSIALNDEVGVEGNRGGIMSDLDDGMRAGGAVEDVQRPRLIFPRFLYNKAKKKIATIAMNVC